MISACTKNGLQCPIKHSLYFSVSCLPFPPAPVSLLIFHNNLGSEPGNYLIWLRWPILEQNFDQVWAKTSGAAITGAWPCPRWQSMKNSNPTLHLPPPPYLPVWSSPVVLIKWSYPYHHHHHHHHRSTINTGDACAVGAGSERSVGWLVVTWPILLLSLLLVPTETSPTLELSSPW